jgi:hypothetical protein
MSSALGEDTIAISSKVSKDYVRRKLPDGSYAPETYAFGEGDNWGGVRLDFSADHLKFMDVARAMAVPLAQKNYIPTHDKDHTDLLIMVYWGTTLSAKKPEENMTMQKMQDADRGQDQAQMMLNHASSASEHKAATTEVAAAAAQMRTALIELQSENQRREDDDAKTVTLLGYDSWWLDTEAASGGGERAFRKRDMLDEVEQDRYFVVLMAYDFPSMMKKKTKLLWEVHFSVREQGHLFDKELPGMIAKASEYFGRESGGLLHEDIEEGKVIIGPVKSLGATNSQ